MPIENEEKMPTDALQSEPRAWRVAPSAPRNKAAARGAPWRVAFARAWDRGAAEARVGHCRHPARGG
jgi:hypothetical protein